MSLKHFAVITILVFTVAFAIQLGPQNNVEAKSPIQVAQVPQRVAQSQSLRAVEYAILEVDLDEDAVTWRIGGNERDRTETLLATYRRLGGTDRGSFTNLLNQIGAGGWNLVQRDGGTWIFSRRAGR